jgi:branched-chain amino acid aminotransferase
LNGSFVPEQEARLSIYDSALVMGDMAYEVTRTCGQRLFRLDEHLARLEHSLEALEIDAGLSRREWRQITEETLARNLPSEAADVDWNVIHNVSRGPAGGFARAFSPDQLRPTALVSCYPLTDKMAQLAPTYTDGVDLVVPRQQSIPASLMPTDVKTRSRLHYQLANLQAQAMQAGAWAVLTDPDGYMTEGTSGNVFFARGEWLFTPSRRNVLPGVTRDWVLQICEREGIDVEEVDWTPAEVTTCDEAMVCSTSIGLIHARSFQGRAVGMGQLGPLASRVRRAMFEEVGLDFAEQARTYALRQRKS